MRLVGCDMGHGREKNDISSLDDGPFAKRRGDLVRCFALLFDV